MDVLFHVVCAQCVAVNRVAPERAQHGPVCGKCGGKLLPGKPVALTAATFPTFIAKTDLPVLVDFWAPWCGPCRGMAPAFEQAAAQLHPAILLAKVDTEAEQALAAQFRIQSIPTLALFMNGREVDRAAGAMDAASIVAWAQQRAYR